MDKKSRNTIIVSIVALAIVLITVTYAYFSARITGIESASTISLTAGRMEIVYTEGNEILSFGNIYPREEAWVTKTFTLTGYNTTELDMQYTLALDITSNTFPSTYLTYDLRMVSSTNGTPIATKTNMPITGVGTLRLGTGTFTNANGDTHNYELKIYFKDNGLDQNDAQEAIFNARLIINEPRTRNIALDDTNSVEIITGYDYNINYDNCYMAFNNYISSSESTEICSGREIYANSASIEKIIKEGSADDLINNSIIENVVRDNNNNITSYNINYNNCMTIISNAPYSNSEKATFCNGGVIDVDSRSIQKDIDLGYGEDYVDEGVIENVVRDGNNNITSYTINENSCNNYLHEAGNNIFDVPVETLSSIICSGNVYHNNSSIDVMLGDSKGMEFLTENRAINSLVVHSKREINPGTQYVDGQYTYTFINEYCENYECEILPYENSGWEVSLTNSNSSDPITTLLCTTINGKPIISMNSLFAGSNATSIDLSSFDTSHVIDMRGMFYRSKATTIDLSSFDTSQVTNMSGMFSNSYATTLDLRSFDTSNVNYMSGMFDESRARTIIAKNDAEADRYYAQRSLVFESGNTDIIVGGRVKYDSVSYSWQR